MLSAWTYYLDDKMLKQKEKKINCNWIKSEKCRDTNRDIDNKNITQEWTLTKINFQNEEKSIFSFRLNFILQYAKANIGSK